MLNVSPVACIVLMLGIVVSCLEPEGRGFKLQVKIKGGQVGGVRIKFQDTFTDVLSGKAKIRIRLKLPDLKRVSEKCPKNVFYTSMNPNHHGAVSEMQKIFLSGNSTEQGLELAMQLRDEPEVNTKAWYRALINFAYENPDLKTVAKPSPFEVMPDMFVDQATLDNAFGSDSTENAGRAFGGPSGCPIMDEQVGIKNGVENRLWYFRENMFLNVHHWMYHVANPFQPVTYTSQDRRGELFYYFHHSFIARYNGERLSNGLRPTVPFTPRRGAIVEEGYISNLKDKLSGTAWTDRAPNARLADIRHGRDPGLEMDVAIAEIVLAKDRILQAIRAGYLQARNGRRVSLTSWKSMTILGDEIQASNFSLNPNFYGLGGLGLHNYGHILLSYISDPYYQTRVPAGVLLDEGTSARDPVFYRWHAFIDEIFDKYLQTLPPYQPTGGELQLLWKGIHISQLMVHSLVGSSPANELQTFFSFSKLKLTTYLNFKESATTGNERSLCVKHLNHNKFEYRFVVERERTVKTSRATIRIFMAPRLLSKGKPVSMLIQRPFFFVMDTFSVDLRFGKNLIRRNSTQSTLTLPTKQDLYELANHETDDQLAFCGCGWPHHLLLPKGAPGGMRFDLFVMVTNGDMDDPKEPWRNEDDDEDFCRSAYLYCGIPGRKYPDARPMGYPFDRLPYKIRVGNEERYVQNFDQYVKGISNVATQQVIIKHNGDSVNTCCKKFG